MRPPPRVLSPLAVAAALAFAAHAAPARADAPRVVLVAPDGALESAVRSSLAPWGTDVLTVADVPPDATMPGSAEQGRAIAARTDAQAVVWISASSSGRALWVYDRETDRVLARPLAPAPPFDDATAAAIALTVKTLLRHSAAAPPGERAVVPLPSAPAAPPQPPAAPPLPAAPQPPRAAAPSPSPRGGVAVSLAASGGAAAWTTSVPSAEPRVGLSVDVWPERARVLSLSLGARLGPGVVVASSQLDARWTDTAVYLGARLLAHAGIWDVGGLLQLGVRISTLDGHAGADAPVHDLRVDPAGALLAELGVRPVPGLRLSVRAGAEVVTSAARYTVMGAPELAVRSVSGLTELVVEVVLP